MANQSQKQEGQFARLRFSFSQILSKAKLMRERLSLIYVTLIVLWLQVVSPNDTGDPTLELLGAQVGGIRLGDRAGRV